MNYNGVIYRPPVEAFTSLLAMTEGCTHNSCRFCNMYRDIPFRMLPLNQVEEELAKIREQYGYFAKRIDRLYLVGGDPFALSANNLERRINLVRQYLPSVSVISMYASISNIRLKSDEDLLRLRELGVNDLYIGIESGLDDVLLHLNKGHTVDEARQQCLRLNRAGIRHRDLLMLGTAGTGRGEENAQATARLENAIEPTMTLLTTMTAFEGTDLNKEIEDGSFIPAGEREILMEEKSILQALELPDAYFWAVHPLDSVRIEGWLRDKKEDMLVKLEKGLATVKDEHFVRSSRKGTL